MSTFFRQYARTLAAAAFTILLTVNSHAGPTFTPQTFANGTAFGATQPDSIYVGDGSVWVAYQNGADSTGLSGLSTVARYSPSGVLQNTWSIAGNVDGLRIDPATGPVWALQNNDGNSTLTIVNPTSNTTTLYN